VVLKPLYIPMTVTRTPGHSKTKIETIFCIYKPRKPFLSRDKPLDCPRFCWKPLYPPILKMYVYYTFFRRECREWPSR
jgi:hypothetical protein